MNQYLRRACWWLHGKRCQGVLVWRPAAVNGPVAGIEDAILLERPAYPQLDVPDFTVVAIDQHKVDLWVVALL